MDILLVCALDFSGLKMIRRKDVPKIVDIKGGGGGVLRIEKN